MPPGGQSTGSQNVNQTTTNVPWGPQQPYLEGLFGQAQGAYNFGPGGQGAGATGGAPIQGGLGEGGYGQGATIPPPANTGGTTLGAGGTTSIPGLGNISLPGATGGGTTSGNPPYTNWSQIYAGFNPQENNAISALGGFNNAWDGPGLFNTLNSSTGAINSLTGAVNTTPIAATNINSAPVGGDAAATASPVAGIIQSLTGGQPQYGTGNTNVLQNIQSIEGLGPQFSDSQLQSSIAAGLQPSVNALTQQVLPQIMSSAGQAGAAGGSREGTTLDTAVNNWLGTVANAGAAQGLNAQLGLGGLQNTAFGTAANAGTGNINSIINALAGNYNTLAGVGGSTYNTGVNSATALQEQQNQAAMQTQQLNAQLQEQLNALALSGALGTPSYTQGAYGAEAQPLAGNLNLGQLLQGNTQGELTAQTQAPWTGLSSLSQAITGNYGGTNTTQGTTTQNAPFGANLLGGALGGAGLGYMAGPALASALGLGTISSGAGAGGGALLGLLLGGLCWVAREVYGEDNPRWKQFRRYLLTKAPTWLFKLYVEYGERFAAFIKNKPRLKLVVKLWMEYCLCQ